MEELKGDCANCFGLCCVALPFAKSADFAATKDAGTPCRNLLADHRCGIHDQLRPKGYAGCTVYDCFGAGQRVSQTVFGGVDWRIAEREKMFAVFPVVRQLHELLWYLAEAGRLDPHDDLAAAFAEVERHAVGAPDDVLVLDVAEIRAKVNVLLLRTSERLRSSAKSYRGADLIGARLRNKNLGSADFRGAYLIGADLTNSDLSRADMIGADLRGADLSGADLSTCLFLTQPQVNAARGNARTKLPDALTRPSHWSAEPARRR
ncbi:pentapeptide repeat-containing protein [Lentzea sp. BCCO 10_0061]|uniref:Pentapeptide repeat-containing protein n=1 Tax=Lentzea sokolovensis TaxID=3095429 RepID=A0ABU4VAT7_9PSEU|nr:pentapeptide repeat-containing protein [Lentzea sp. BCCO 10_0061]MDX8148575.1 pentapeptide repeat-containing protein [Lentzea sp. BCCO 10_0061]